MHRHLDHHRRRRPGDVLTVRHLRVGGHPARDRTGARRAAEAGARLRPPAPPVDRPGVERARRRWFDAQPPGPRRAHRGHRRALRPRPRRPARGAATGSAPTTLPAGCSVAFYPGAGTKDGHGILSRNFDFPTATFTQIIGLPPLPASGRWPPTRGWSSCTPTTATRRSTVGIMDVMGAHGRHQRSRASPSRSSPTTRPPNPSRPAAPRVGLAEQQVVRYLLDTCATVDEAKEALLLAKHYYFFTPCHFVVADRSGASFVWEHSPRRNREVIVDADPRRRPARVHQPPAAPVARPGAAARRRRTDRHRRAHLPPLADADDAATATAPSSTATTSASSSPPSRFGAPIDEAGRSGTRIYDVDDGLDGASRSTSTTSTDESIYTEPIRVELGDGWYAFRPR